MRHDISTLSLSLQRNAALRRWGGWLTVPAAMALLHLKAAYQAAPVDFPPFTKPYQNTLI
jgi:hypothetical protein